MISELWGFKKKQLTTKKQEGGRGGMGGDPKTEKKEMKQIWHSGFIRVLQTATR